MANRGDNNMNGTPNEMQISEHELTVMTRDLEEMHYATLPVMHEAISEWAELQHELPADESEAPVITRRGSSRRRFLVGAGATMGGLLTAACSSSKKTTTATTPTTATSTG